MKYIRRKHTPNCIYIVIDETPTDYAVIQRMDYEGVDTTTYRVDLKCWWSKEFCEEVPTLHGITYE
jgi:hypothetical protein